MHALDRYRNTRDHWSELAPDFGQSTNTEDEAIDLNAKQRYATLLAIQYDFQESDKELVRYLFAQEIDSLINDDTSGTTYSLKLGAYLLASYRDPLDIPSFYKAKNIDMDTASGFDIEFMYSTLGSGTFDYIRSHFPDLYEDIKDEEENDRFFQRLDSWWTSLCERYPAHPADETDYAMYERHLYFGDREQARIHIENWARDCRDEREVSVTLEYAYKALGAYREVIKILEVNLSQAKPGWDKISVISDLLKMYVGLNSPPEAFAYFAQADAELSTFQDWKGVGLGRMLVHSAFEYAALCDDDHIAISSCGFALSWCQELTSHYYVLLVAGEKATRRCQLTSLAEEFKQRAETERQRIDALFRK
ncbi:MAG: hypothetical protein V4495_24725 [Pseudomonadota bacterium]